MADQQPSPTQLPARTPLPPTTPLPSSNPIPIIPQLVEHCLKLTTLLCEVRPRLQSSSESREFIDATGRQVEQLVGILGLIIADPSRQTLKMEGILGAYLDEAKSLYSTLEGAVASASSKRQTSSEVQENVEVAAETTTE